jgi:hypothetical protein
MSSLVVLCLSSHYRIVLLPYYELVPPPASVGYIQTILNDVVRASPRLVPPPVSHVCHRSGPDLFLCCHTVVTHITCMFTLQKLYQLNVDSCFTILFTDTVFVAIDNILIQCRRSLWLRYSLTFANHDMPYKMKWREY